MQNYRKVLRPIDVFGIAIGAIIGWGCFVLPGNSFLPKAGPLGTAIGLFIGMLLIVVISRSYSYLIIKHPLSGGEYEYTKSRFGRLHAYICGWSLILAYGSLVPLNATAISLVIRYLLGDYMKTCLLYTIAGYEVYLPEILLALVFIAAIGWLNVHGMKFAIRLQTVISLLLVGTVCLVTALVLLSKPDFSNLLPLFSDRLFDNPGSGIFAVVAMAPWAYVGFDCIPQMAEEYNFSVKKTRALMVISIAAAMLMYIFVNTITALAIPWEQMLDSKEFWPTGSAVSRTVGTLGLALIGIAMFCAVVAGINAFYMASSRLICYMANDGALPAVFGKMDVKHGTPKNAVLFIGVFSLIFPWFGREVLGWVVDMTSVGTALAFGYTTLSAALTAREEHKTWQMVLSFAGVAFSLFFLVLLLVPGMPGFLSAPSLIALGAWVLLGAGFYIFMRKSSPAKA